MTYQQQTFQPLMVNDRFILFNENIYVPEWLIQLLYSVQYPFYPLLPVYLIMYV